VEDAVYGSRLAGFDPAALLESFAVAMLDVARRPGVAAREAARLALAELEEMVAVGRSILGDDHATPSAPEDPRFSDRAWKENPFLRFVHGTYRASATSLHRLLDSTDVPEPTRRKARFVLDLWLDAASPTNVPWLNPQVAKEAIDTGGLSLLRGVANFVRDAGQGGMPSQAPGSFEVGQSLAATPGRVVFRNDLIELIAYEPQTETVFADPIVYSPPWINKYYVLDLAPGRSFVEYAVRAGFTVFAISYRNPDASQATLTMDDYLREGLLTAVDTAATITGSRHVNLLGVCLGGTLTAIALAVLAARGDADRVGCATLLNTLVDFSDPGEISVFTDKAAIERIERRMFGRGYLEPAELSGPFTWMRANELVWNRVVSSWYLGKRPPAFDILAWNDDATRLPAAMHSQYLRACYLNNLLVQPGAFVIDGTPVDVGLVETPLFVLGSEKDHIAPWRTTYRTTQLVAGEVRYVLSPSGHIAGMVSPPGSSNTYYRRRQDCPPTADEWLDAAERVTGSWWEEWTAWAASRSGEQAAPPELPAGEPAPGSYVRG
jgi:polyhydroxyalkanoate synthase